MRLQLMCPENKTGVLPEQDSLDVKIIDTPEQRASPYAKIRQEILRVLLSGFQDYSSTTRKEQRLLVDGTRNTEEIMVVTSITRFWMTAPEILEMLLSTSP